MADLAPQRARHPLRSVVTVADLLGRTSEPTEDDPNGRFTGQSSVSVSALIRREGCVGDLPGGSVEPHSDRTVTGLGATRRRLISFAGAVLTVGSLASAAVMLGDARPGPASSGALDGGHPGPEVVGQAGDGSAGDLADNGLSLALATMARSTPLMPTGIALPTAALSSGVVPSVPAGAGLAPAVRGDVISGIVRTGDALVGGTVNGLGRVGRTTDTLDHPLSSAHGTLGEDQAPSLTGEQRGDTQRITDSSPAPAGSALSTLTNPITIRDGAPGPVAPPSEDKRSSEGSSVARTKAGQPSLPGLGALSSGDTRSSGEKSSTKSAQKSGDGSATLPDSPTGRRSVDGPLSGATSSLSKKHSSGPEQHSSSSEKHSGGVQLSKKTGKRLGGSGSALSDGD